MMPVLITWCDLRTRGAARNQLQFPAVSTAKTGIATDSAAKKKESRTRTCRSFFGPCPPRAGTPTCAPALAKSPLFAAGRVQIHRVYIGGGGLRKKGLSRYGAVPHRDSPALMTPGLFDRN
eukprot:3298043-Rhodomonas_salina.2